MKLFGVLKRRQLEKRHDPKRVKHSVPTEIVFEEPPLVDRVPMSGDTCSYNQDGAISSETSQLTDEQYYIDRYEAVIATEESDDESAFDAKVNQDLQHERERIKLHVRKLLKEHDDDDHRQKPWQIVNSPNAEDATTAASTGFWMFACYGSEKCRGQQT